ncbi:unnamed protein product (macronuclear) [Paramecium tetraurelia]|uniref:Uncharacterized protein n=1 Tax=Paramecium tetraurelia TaxID=5888 RepID=A0BKK6_PARTE|nr:uncharacterized protein GSPATT00029704001 [Paramecium tetraurelia]CAK59073.1 unnamed protein product [Paramecium tetraurelia]|eukprot:XP_001426471.1 hypothetical protein (macronuclear) [Paramecium tetraurelia strain d4-2]
MKHVSPKTMDKFNADPRSSLQSCHLSKSKPLMAKTPLQYSKSSSLIQSLNGLSKYFNKKEENNQLAYQAPQSIQRSSASLSHREKIADDIQNKSPLFVKQLLYGKDNQKENFNYLSSKSKQIPYFSITQDPKLVQVNDSSHKNNISKILRNEKFINGSIEYQEDWKLKYEDLQQSLCQRIQQLEIELQSMEKNKKIDQMHTDQQTNQYIEKLQYIVSEKEQVILEQELKNEELQNIIDMQQTEIQKYKDGMQNIKNANEIQRLQQIDQKFQQIKGHFSSLKINIQQTFDVAQSEQQINNLSLSSFSVIEMINEFNQVIEVSTQKSMKKQHQKEFQQP